MLLFSSTVEANDMNNWCNSATNFHSVVQVRIIVQLELKNGPNRPHMVFFHYIN